MDDVQKHPHLSHEQAQLEIHNARWKAIDGLIAELDSEIAELDAQYYSHKEPTESQVIVYMAQHNALLRFRQILVRGKHAADLEYQRAVNKS